MDKIIHHNDLDGYCSMAIIKQKFPKAETIEFNYGKEIPMDKIKKGDKVAMVDVSFPIKEMKKIKDLAEEFVWIDHHVSAIKDYDEEKDLELDGKREIGKAGCELTWEYFYPKEKEPLIIHLIGRFDVWDKKNVDKWDNFIMPAHYGLRSFSLTKIPWEKLFNSNKEVKKIVEDGKTIIKFADADNEEYAKKYAYDVNFEGYKAVALNRGNCSSNLFDSVWDIRKYDIMLPFVFDGDHYSVSIYTTKENIDCSKIAKKHDGGGHAKASGFTCKKLPF